MRQDFADHVSWMDRNFSEVVERLTALSFDAFENRANGRLAGAFMKMANAHRRYLEDMKGALEVVDEELGRHG